MELARVLSFPFEDRAWVEKLVITALITGITLILTPFFVGLLGWAALLGYQVELVRNWRAGTPNPLPTWNNFSALLNKGFVPLIALLVYQVPNMIIGMTVLTLSQNLNAGVVGSILIFALGCCLFPILLVYNAFTLPMFGLAMGRYAEDGRWRSFFEIGVLLVTLRDHAGMATLYVIFTLVINIGIAVAGIIPLLGWGLIVALAVPVFGGLNGQLGLAILGKLQAPTPPVRVVAPPPRRR